MRAAFVLATVVFALALSVVAAASESRLLIRALVIGFVPAMWGVQRVLERLTGRDMWSFSPARPYRSKRDRGETTMPTPNSVREPADERDESDDRSTPSPAWNDTHA